MQRRRAKLAFFPFLAVLLASVPARAWYFPEHVVLTSDGHAALPAELRAVIAVAVAAARSEGLSLCASTDLRLDEVLEDVPLKTPSLVSPSRVACVPYAALPGLAGDHAADVAELRSVLTTSRGIELVTAVAYEWRRFHRSALRGQASLDRMSFVHDLDVELYFIDPGYVERARATRAHFRDVGRSFDDVLRALGAEGRIDEVTSRVVFHHVRSLLLAASKRPTEALLEHAFALHFLEDAFASGHLVMSAASWAEGRDAVRWRHDAFNADGLLVTRAMSKEPCSSLATGTLELAGLPPCWTTSGDGHLGLHEDASDRLHIAAALTRAETAFAMALDPDRVVAFAAGLGDLDLMALGSKLDPAPWWTVDQKTRRTLPAGTRHAMRLVRSAAQAARTLRALPVPPPGHVDVPRLEGAVVPALIAGVLAPPRIITDDNDEHDPAASINPIEDASEEPGYAVGARLVRPILAQLPTAQADTTKMKPEGHLDHGWAIQLFASTGAMVLVPSRGSPVDFFTPAVGVSAGFSYRWGSLLPGRRARSIAEVNLGVSQMLHFNSSGDSGGNTHVTFLDQELRWPVVWEALTTYNKPLDLEGVHRAGRLLFLNGIRAHELVRGDSVSFLGLELEAAAIALSEGRGTHPLYFISPEVRFFVGLANPRAAQPSFSPALGPTFGITLTGGYATLL